MLNFMTIHDLSHKMGSKYRTPLVNVDVSLPRCVWSRLNDVYGLHCIDDAVKNDWMEIKSTYTLMGESCQD